MKISERDIIFGEMVLADPARATKEMTDILTKQCSGIFISIEFYSFLIDNFNRILKESVEASGLTDANEHYLEAIAMFVFFLRTTYSANGEMITDISLKRFKKILAEAQADESFYEDVYLELRRLNEDFCLKMIGHLNHIMPLAKLRWFMLVVIKTFLHKIEDAQRIHLVLVEMVNRLWPKPR